jgi:hypothetical protein
MDFKELDERLAALTKDRDYHETQNKELNKLLGEAKAKNADLEKKLSNVPKPPEPPKAVLKEESPAKANVTFGPILNI